MRISPASSNQRRFHLSALRPSDKRTVFSRILLIVAVVGWFVFWLIERIDFAQVTFPLSLPLPQFFVGVMTIFMPRVLRHLIPVLLGFLLAYEVASNLLFYLYDLPNHTAARGFLLRLINSRFFAGTPIEVTPQTLEKQRKESARIRAGGPGRFKIPVGHVAVTELDGRYNRTLAAGIHLLENFEHIHAVLDLRSQHRSNGDARFQSREGIEVSTQVGVTFRIKTGSVPISPSEQYPFDPEIVRKLAYSGFNLPENHVSSWEDSALRIVIRLLRKSAIAFSLDELLEEPESRTGAHFTIRRYVEETARESSPIDENATREDFHRVADAARENSPRVEVAAREDSPKQDLEISRVRIGHFGFPDDVTEQHIDHWLASQENKVEKARVEGKAIDVESMEVIRAEAEMGMARLIATEMQKVREDLKKRRESEKDEKDEKDEKIAEDIKKVENVFVALRLIEALERIALQSQTDVSLPDHMLHHLQELHQQILTAVDWTANHDQDDDDDQGDDDDQEPPDLPVPI